MSTAGRARGAAVCRTAQTAAFVWGHFKFNLASAMEYRWSFVSQMLFMVLNDFLLLFFWWLIFGKVQAIGGWTFADVITMHAVLATAYGLSVSVFGNVNRLARIIAEGQLDYYLLLPRNPLVHALVSRSDISGLGDVAFGLAAFCLFTPVTPGRLALFAIVSLASCTVYTCFAVITGSIAFFIGNAQTISAAVARGLDHVLRLPRLNLPGPGPGGVVFGHTCRFRDIRACFAAAQLQRRPLRRLVGFRGCDRVGRLLAVRSRPPSLRVG